MVHKFRRAMTTLNQMYTGSLLVIRFNDLLYFVNGEYSDSNCYDQAKQKSTSGTYCGVADQ